jgi:preprotein translocase subunit SecA
MLKLLLGDPNARKLKRYQPIVSDINLLEEDIAPLSDDELRGKTAVFQERLENAGSLQNQQPILDEILAEAFAVVREANKRMLGISHSTCR